MKSTEPSPRNWKYPSVSDLIVSRFNELVNNTTDTNIDQAKLGDLIMDVASLDGKNHLEEMKVLLTKILLIPESHDAILALLQSYQAHDGYSRQILFGSLLDATYSKADLPFLKSVFLASLVCKTGNYPNRLQGWIRPLTFAHYMGPTIYGLASSPSISGPMDEAKRKLLYHDPKKMD